MTVCLARPRALFHERRGTAQGAGGVGFCPVRKQASGRGGLEMGQQRDNQIHAGPQLVILLEQALQAPLLFQGNCLGQDLLHDRSRGQQMLRERLRGRLPRREVVGIQLGDPFLDLLDTRDPADAAQAVDRRLIPRPKLFR